MATRRVVTRHEQEIGRPLVITEDTVTPWAELVAEGSRLRSAPGSLLQQRFHRDEHGKIRYSNSHIPRVIQALTQAGIFPDTLIPQSFWDKTPAYSLLGWGPRTDALFNLAEDFADTTRLIINLAIADSVTVNKLSAARKARDISQERTIVEARLSAPDNAWLLDLVDEEEGQGFLHRLVDFHIAVMESRLARGTKTVQTAADIWRKLIIGNWESKSSDRLGEYSELLFAAEVLGNRGIELGLRVRDPEINIMTLGSQLDQAFSTVSIDEEKFFGNDLAVLVRYFLVRIALDIGLDIGKITTLALEKQLLRIEIGNTFRQMMTGKGIKAEDLSEVPKAITQLFLPYLVYAALPRAA